VSDIGASPANMAETGSGAQAQVLDRRNQPR